MHLTAWLVLGALFALPACGDTTSAGTASDAAIDRIGDAGSNVADADGDADAMTDASPDARGDAGDDGAFCTPPAELVPIADSGPGCVYDVAAVFAGDSGHDPTHLDIRLPDCPGGPVDLLLRPSLASCTSAPGAVFDSPTSPTQLELCPDTCAQALGACGGRVEILFGCSVTNQ